MTSDKPLQYFLQPSLLLAVFSLWALLGLIALALMVPYPIAIRLTLLLIFVVCWSWQFNHSVLLRNKRSIICLGRDSQGWWFQRRNGHKVYGVLGAGCVLWQHLLIVELRPATWRWPVVVMLMRDSFETEQGFRDLKYQFYIAAQQQNHSVRAK